MTKRSEVAVVSELLNQKITVSSCVLTAGWFQGGSSHTKGWEEAGGEANPQTRSFWFCLLSLLCSVDKVCIYPSDTLGKVTGLMQLKWGELAVSRVEVQGWGGKGTRWLCGFKDRCSGFLNSAQWRGHSWSKPLRRKGTTRSSGVTPTTSVPSPALSDPFLLTLPQVATLEAAILGQTLNAKWGSPNTFGKLWSFERFEAGERHCFHPSFHFSLLSSSKPAFYTKAYTFI